jgi:hypothetical protein
LEFIGDMIRVMGKRPDKSAVWLSLSILLLLFNDESSLLLFNLDNAIIYLPKMIEV